ncbi:hypothetical protein [Candidatus Parabeggiatoa sp. HSG14]|uniref:hypothetical protein n=1 Tax=Candidatus Parabeggiatoa sp. HSG14 TaxID=3055593 RepID=UPI0025A702E2|nr:hypothetical protein [Thiotrichales bacterium HSG14]
MFEELIEYTTFRTDKTKCRMALQVVTVCAEEYRYNFLIDYEGYRDSDSDSGHKKYYCISISYCEYQKYFSDYFYLYRISFFYLGIKDLIICKILVLSTEAQVIAFPD